MDAFFVSVELLERPELRGKPVIVGGGSPDQRGVVTSASYEARKFGVHSAMPLRTAGKLCPHGIFLDGHHHKYSEWSDRVATILGKFSPIVEMVSIDEAYHASDEISPRQWMFQGHGANRPQILHGEMRGRPASHPERDVGACLSKS